VTHEKHLCESQVQIDGVVCVYIVGMTDFCKMTIIRNLRSSEAGARTAQSVQPLGFVFYGPGVRIPVGTKFFSYFNVQTGSKVHLASYAMGTGTPSQRKGGRGSEFMELYIYSPNTPSRHGQTKL